jgi:hypothetical protein
MYDSSALKAYNPPAFGRPPKICEAELRARLGALGNETANPPVAELVN